MGYAAELVHNGAFVVTDDTTSISLGDSGDGKGSTHFVQVTGTWTATLIFEGTMGDPVTGTYVTVGYVTPADPGTVQTAGTFTANGIYIVRGDGLSNIRIRASIEGTGTPVIRRRAIYA